MNLDVDAENTNIPSIGKIVIRRTSNDRISAGSVGAIVRYNRTDTWRILWFTDENENEINLWGTYKLPNEYIDIQDYTVNDRSTNNTSYIDRYANLAQFFRENSTSTDIQNENGEERRRCIECVELLEGEEHQCNYCLLDNTSNNQVNCLFCDKLVDSGIQETICNDCRNERDHCIEEVLKNNYLCNHTECKYCNNCSIHLESISQIMDEMPEPNPISEEEINKMEAIEAKKRNKGKFYNWDKLGGYVKPIVVSLVNIDENMKCFSTDISFPVVIEIANRCISIIPVGKYNNGVKLPLCEPIKMNNGPTFDITIFGFLVNRGTEKEIINGWYIAKVGSNFCRNFTWTENRRILENVIKELNLEFLQIIPEISIIDYSTSSSGIILQMNKTFDSCKYIVYRNPVKIIGAITSIYIENEKITRCNFCTKINNELVYRGEITKLITPIEESINIIKYRKRNPKLNDGWHDLGLNYSIVVKAYLADESGEYTFYKIVGFNLSYLDSAEDGM